MAYPAEDRSWDLEWKNFGDAIADADASLLKGDLEDARYAWEQVEAAYASGPYADTREAVAG